MKKTKTTRVIALLTAVILAAFCFAACGKTEDKKDGDDSSGKSAIYTIGDVEVKSVAVKMVGETPNLQIVLANNTDKDADVDFSKLTVKLSDGTEIGNLGLTRTVEANNTYSQHAITIEQKYGVKLGDKVEICYGGDVIDTVEVEEF